MLSLLSQKRVAQNLCTHLGYLRHQWGRPQSSRLQPRLCAIAGRRGENYRSNVAALVSVNVLIFHTVRPSAISV